MCFNCETYLHSYLKTVYKLWNGSHFDLNNNYFVSDIWLPLKTLNQTDAKQSDSHWCLLMDSFVKLWDKCGPWQRTRLWVLVQPAHPEDQWFSCTWKNSSVRKRIPQRHQYKKPKQSRGGLHYDAWRHRPWWSSCQIRKSSKAWIMALSTIAILFHMGLWSHCM